MLGPMFQTPLKCGADISLCSLTKYVGGHSDLVGGSISGDVSLVKQVMGWRSSIGTRTRSELLLDADALSRNPRDPHDAVERQRPSRRRISGRPSQGGEGALSRLPQGGRPRKAVFDRQCSAPGSTFAFDVKGGEKEAFALLDHLQVMKLAVSLGAAKRSFRIRPQ